MPERPGIRVNKNGIKNIKSIKVNVKILSLETMLITAFVGSRTDMFRNALSPNFVLVLGMN